jgi:hypothetical protein
MSEDKLLTDGEYSSIEEVRQELVRNRDGSERAVYRKNGMFAKREQPDLSLDTIQAATVARLTQEDESGRSPYQKAVDNVIKNAAIDAEQPVLDKFGNAVLKEDGTPYTVVCPKTMMAASKNFDSVARILGLPKKDVEEKFPVRVVILSPSPNMVNREVKEYKPIEARAQPQWAEITDLYTNDPAPAPQAPPPQPAKPTRAELANVNWLMQCNSSEMDKRMSGVPMSAVIAKAQTDSGVVVSSRNIIKAGFFRVAAASIQNQETISVEVEQE